MPTINIEVKNKIARQTNKEVYVCGNSDFAIAFDFDAEWDAHTAKTSRFKYNGSYQDIVFTGNECPVPVISNTNTIQIGVYAGDLHTTTVAVVMARKSILCGDSVHDAPPEDVYNQLMDMTNEIVSRIEALEEGGGTGGGSGVWIGTEQDYDEETISRQTVYFITDGEATDEPDEPDEPDDPDEPTDETTGVLQNESVLYVYSNVSVTQIGDTLTMGG